MVWRYPVLDINGESWALLTLSIYLASDVAHVEVVDELSVFRQLTVMSYEESSATDPLSLLKSNKT